MTNPNQPPLGFVLPGQQASGAYYPPQNQQQGYPPQQYQNQYPPTAGYSAPAPAYNHQPFPAPIQNQPGYATGVNNAMVQWSQSADFQSYLINTSSFIVKQKVELLEAIVGWESENKYTVQDHAKNKIFLVSEQSSCMNRQFCDEYRSFNLTVRDSRGNNVLQFDRDLDCSCCCGLLCPDSINVTTAAGQKLGSVVQEFSICKPRFKLKNSTGKTVLKIEGPCCPCACKCDVTFRLTTKDGTSCGAISKIWGGFTRELLTDADTFSITFPQDLDVAMKAVCLGALFLIDFRYFESESGGVKAAINSIVR